MKIFHGIPVFPGVVYASLDVVLDVALHIPKSFVDVSQTPMELTRLEYAFKAAQASVSANRDAATRQLGAEYGSIFDAHLMFLNDPAIRRRIETNVKENCFSAEYAVDSAYDFYVKTIQSLEGAVYAERANDVEDVKELVLRELLNMTREESRGTREPKILATSCLKPNDASKLDRETTLAIITESGGLGSHTAIVAAALRIPTVLGLGDFLDEACQANFAIVDGGEGTVILDPTREVFERYEKRVKLQQEAQLKERKRAQESFDVKTKDGASIEIKGNIEFPHEVETCAEMGACGIGLYRTEFLYLTENNGFLPDEETHFEAYKQVLEAFERMKKKQTEQATLELENDKRLTPPEKRKILDKIKERRAVVRTFDLGADKLPERFRFTREPEPNPFMGLRSIRLSLRNTNMFRVQLRALLRASKYGKLAVMFPLVSNVVEFRQAKTIFNDVKDDLADAGVPFDPSVPLGIMVETPATVVTLERFGPEVDFFSIGTNDLLQYTTAVDRSNPIVGGLYEQESPALIRMILQTVKIANLYGKPVSLCGQMGSMPNNVPLLLGLGVRTLSVAPGMIPAIREACQAFTIDECYEIAETALGKETASSIRIFLRDEMKKKKLIPSYDDN